ncbi:hypothetical protein PR048_028689 [Dryococelus australis]|uniref:Uncharacterized protein n=1 Tax=Dryococelus australis TaxID=614101 RepID=A0ABQ9GBA0_9NEOP|nr:hypothetical protein PR048_028689 [Dryococelus australis]
MQNKTLRSISRVPRYTPTKLIHKELEMQTIMDFIINLAEGFFYKTTEEHPKPLIRALGKYEYNFNNNYNHSRPHPLEEVGSRAIMAHYALTVYIRLIPPHSALTNLDHPHQRHRTAVTTFHSAEDNE